MHCRDHDRFVARFAGIENLDYATKPARIGETATAKFMHRPTCSSDLLRLVHGDEITSARSFCASTSGLQLDPVHAVIGKRIALRRAIRLGVQTTERYVHFA